MYPYSLVCTAPKRAYNIESYVDPFTIIINLFMNDIETTTPPAVAEAPKQAEAPQDNTVLMSILSYIGILVIIPYLTAKQNPVVRFHIQQGLLLFSLEVVVMIVGGMLYLFFLIPLLNFGLLVLSIIGIVNALNKKQVPLPLIGQYAKHFDF